MTIWDYEEIKKETEQHLWLERRHNGQDAAWATAKGLWEKSTKRPWPNMSLSYDNMGNMEIKEQKHNKQPGRSTWRSKQYTKGTHPRSDEKRLERDAFLRRQQEDDSTACSTDPLGRWTPDRLRS